MLHACFSMNVNTILILNTTFNLEFWHRVCLYLPSPTSAQLHATLLISL